MATRMQQRRGTAAQWTSANPVLAAGEIGFETDTNKFKIGNGSTAWASLSYFVDGSAIVDGAPELLNTLNEVAAALGDDPSFFTTVANNLANHESDTTNIHGIANTAVLVTLDGSQTLTNKTLTSPSLNGTPTAPTANAATNTTQIATTAFVNTAINNLIDAAPGTLDTLNELAAALNDNPNYAVEIQNNFNSVNNALADIANALANVIEPHLYADSNVHGIANTLALADFTYVNSYTANAVNAHAAITTDIHGIANTLALASLSNVATSVSDHNAVTTSVHGIANTAALVLTSDSRLSDQRTPTDGSVAEGKIASGAVTNSKIGADAVDGTKIADDSIAAEHIADEAITNAHISNTAAIAQSKVSGLTTDLGNKQDKVSGVSNTEIGYLDGVTSNIQAQIDGKAALSGAAFTGNVSTTGDFTVDGTFTVNGSNVLVSATQIQIEDTMIQLGHTNAGNTTDLGLFASYNDGTQKHTGLVKDVTDGKWKLFDGVTTEPGATVDFTQGSLDTLKVGALEAANVITATSGVAFSDGTQTKEAVPSRTAITSATGAYNLSTGGLALRDGLIEANSGSAFTITIPTNSTTAYPVGTSIDVLQVGSGQITIAGDTGVTVNGTPGLKLRTQWSSATLFKRATDSWVVLGDLTA